jgi:hypothetical protein
MLRKTIIALMALAAVGFATPTGVFARGGGVAATVAVVADSTVAVSTVAEAASAAPLFMVAVLPASTEAAFIRGSTDVDLWGSAFSGRMPTAPTLTTTTTMMTAAATSSVAA